MGAFLVQMPADYMTQKNFSIGHNEIPDNFTIRLEKSENCTG